MRKTSAALAALALTAVVLAGCSTAPSFEGATCERTGSANGIDKVISITGKPGSQPTIKIESPLDVSKTAYFDETNGDGEPLVSSQQAMFGAVSLFDGTTGKRVESVGYDQPGGFTIAGFQQQFPGFDKALACATGGSRVVAAVPAADIEAATRSAYGFSEDGTVVAVFDVTEVMLAKAEGDDVFNSERGLPSVVRAPDGRPGVIIPDGAVPTKAKVKTLIAGRGDKVGDQTPLLAYTSVAWDTRSQLSTTWDSAPTTDLSTFPKDVQKAIAGATVGSQLMVIVPGQGGGSATVFVIDVLGAIKAGN